MKTKHLIPLAFTILTLFNLSSCNRTEKLDGSTIVSCSKMPSSEVEALSKKWRPATLLELKIWQSDGPRDCDIVYAGASLHYKAVGRTLVPFVSGIDPRTGAEVEQKLYALDVHDQQLLVPEYSQLRGDYPSRTGGQPQTIGGFNIPFSRGYRGF